MVQTIKNFLVNHYLIIIRGLFGLFFLYWLIFFLTPKIEMAAGEKAQIDSLNNVVKNIYKEQQKLDSSIAVYNKEVEHIDDNISKIKGQKTIIKEVYHEEIKRASTYDDVKLDSFFTNRYGSGSN
jgi:septal ring factor EnvC (AmiA/AmiB activator)